MVSVPLTITFLLFVFDAFIFATASQSAEHAKLYRNKAVHLFDLGFIFMLISLSSVLVQISMWVAIMGIILAILLTSYWIYTKQ
jgi:uncharacterized membrane protein